MPDRLATQLLRASLDPIAGRVQHTGTVDIGLRAALFADLLLAGRIEPNEADRTPFVAEPQPSGDHLLDTLERAVHERKHVAWWRWFRHVRVDRVALIDELVATGRWQIDVAGGRERYTDSEPAQAVQLVADLDAVGLGRRGPADVEEGTLALIAVISGALGERARPRQLRRDLKPLLVRVSSSGAVGAHLLPPMLGGATQLLKRPLRR